MRRLGGAEKLGDFHGGGSAIAGGGDDLTDGARAEVAGDVEAWDEGLVGRGGGGGGRRIGGRGINRVGNSTGSVNGGGSGADIAGGVVKIRGGGGEGGDAGGGGAFADKNKHAVKGIEELGSGLEMLADGDVGQGAELGLEMGLGLEGGVGDEGEGLDKGGEAKGFLDGGVAAADDGDVLALGEVGVAEGAIGNGDGEGEGERAGFGAGGKEDGASADRFAVDGEFEEGGGGGGLKGADDGALAIIDGSTGGFGLVSHGGGEVAAWAGVAWVVADLGDFEEGATNVGALENGDAVAGAGGV